MKLYEMDTTPRQDLNDHPELKPMRPNPVGIADSCVQQYDGTNVFQWWKHCKDAYWRPHGEPVVLIEEGPQSR